LWLPPLLLLQELEAAFVAREIHPKDLKQNVTDALNELLEPIRQHFQQPEMVSETKTGADTDGSGSMPLLSPHAAAYVCCCLSLTLSCCVGQQELIALAYPPESKTELRHTAAALDDDDDVQDGATTAKTDAQSAEAESKAAPAPAAATSASKTPADAEESSLISKVSMDAGTVGRQANDSSETVSCRFLPVICCGSLLLSWTSALAACSLSVG
jgi:hypothetical protein